MKGPVSAIQAWGAEVGGVRVRKGLRAQVGKHVLISINPIAIRYIPVLTHYRVVLGPF